MTKLILAIVLFSALGFYYFNDLNSPSFHPDEYEFIRKSYYFDLFFVKKDTKDLRWYQKDAPGQPKVGPYIYGLTLHLAGINNIEAYFKDIKFNELKIDNQYWWDKLWWKRLVNLSPEVINVLQPVLLGRVTAVIFTLSAFAILFLIGHYFKSITLGLFSTLLLATNFLMSWYGKLALTDSMQLFFFFTNLLLVLFLVRAFQNKGSRKIILISLAIGINCFFGVGVKISGISIYFFLIAIYILLIFLYRAHKNILKLILVSFLISSISFFALFTSLHPYLYKNTFPQFVSMFTERLSYSRVYMQEQPTRAIPRRIDAVRLVLKKTLLPQGIYTNFRSLRIPLDLVFFVAGFALMTRQGLKRLFVKRISGELLLVIWTTLVMASLVFYLRNDWPRFYLPTVSVIAISQAYALTWLFHLVLNKIRK